MTIAINIGPFHKVINLVETRGRGSKLHSRVSQEVRTCRRPGQLTGCRFNYGETIARERKWEMSEMNSSRSTGARHCIRYLYSHECDCGGKKPNVSRTGEIKSGRKPTDCSWNELSIHTSATSAPSPKSFTRLMCSVGTAATQNVRLSQIESEFERNYP